MKKYPLHCACRRRRSVRSLAIVGGARRRFVAKTHEGRRSRRRSSATSASSTTRGFNQNQLKGLNKAEGKLGGQGDPAAVELDERLHRRTSTPASARARTSSSRPASCSRDATATYGEEVPGHASSRSPTTRCTRRRSPTRRATCCRFKNVEGLTYAANESGCLVGVLAAKMAQKLGGNDDRRRRRPQDPAGRHLDRRLQVLRAARPCRARRCSSATRTTSARRTSARPSPQNQIAQGAKVLFQVAGGCGIGTLKAADDGRPVGHRRRRRPVQRREARPDERDQAHRHRRLRRGHAGCSRQVPGRHRPRLQPEEQRRRRRQDQPGRPEGVDHADEQLQGEDHRRDAQGSDVALSVSGARSARGAGRVPAPLRSRVRIARSGDRRPRPRDARDHARSSRASSPTTTSTSSSRRGEVHALLGENGAGKSTLMNILYGLYQPDAGEILLHGKPVTFTSAKDAIEAGIGMVHQHFMLIPVMTVAENIVLGIEPHATGSCSTSAAPSSACASSRSAVRARRRPDARSSARSPSASSSASRS